MIVFSKSVLNQKREKMRNLKKLYAIYHFIFFIVLFHVNKSALAVLTYLFVNFGNKVFPISFQQFKILENVEIPKHHEIHVIIENTLRTKIVILMTCFSNTSRKLLLSLLGV